MSLAPVAAGERIESLDVMRGFAVLGILAVNAQYFAAPWQASQNPLLAPLAVSAATLWAWALMHVLFEFKCITLFSMLFGASLYLVGGERGDLARGAVLRRRLMWLLVFGIIHGSLIWYGDILVAYALTGFLVLFARSWGPRTLMSVGVMFYLMSIGLMSPFGFAAGTISPGDLAQIEAQAWAPGADELERVRGAYLSGLASATRENFSTWVMFVSNALASLIPRTAGVMMIGMALYKLGFLSAKAPVWIYALMAAIGAGALGLIAWQAELNAQAGFDFVHMQTRGHLANLALSILVSIGYASLFAMLVKGGVRVITTPLAAVGRMAFTNYIIQSLIMTTLFWSGRGFGLFGQVDRVTLWGVVLGVWALQLIWSPLWLSRFEMGPLEWVWRRLSYAKPVRLTRAADR